VRARDRPRRVAEGARDYLAKHAWRNATYDDFVTAMSMAAGKDVHPWFDSFVLQRGTPAQGASSRRRAFLRRE
jgi:aminopeptidase N